MFDGIFEPRTLLVVAVVALVLFGPKRLPQLGRSVGRWLGDLRKAAGGLGEELKTGMNESEVTPAPTPPAQAAVPPPPITQPAPVPPAAPPAAPPPAPPA